MGRALIASRPRQSARIAAWLLPLASLLLAPPAARAQISPGPLSRPHAKLDGSQSCLECHSSGRGVDAARCLACHGALSERIAAGKGLHARPDHRACERCHIEHQGAAFELIFWGEAGEKAFDHALAGFALDGAHAALACRSCHRADHLLAPAKLARQGASPARTFLGLGTACTACHADPHGGQFAGDPAGTACTTCHDTRAWKPASRFRHEATSFPLTGAHGGVACARCHAAPAGAARDPGTARYRGTPTACAACHRDPHPTRFGPRCESCHTTADWKQINRGGFDHERTGYPLAGRHTRVACEGCHRPGQPMKIPGAERCSTCHADAHAGQLAERDGGECATCHRVQGFAPATFSVADHDSTAYPLAGAHRAVACAACHAEVPVGELERAGVALRITGPRPATLRRFRFAATGCPDCHRDPHAGSTATAAGTRGCLACHAVSAWAEVRFDHAATAFPLAGAHQAVPCGRCHWPEAAGAGRRARSAPAELRLSGAPRACTGCHRDPHLGQLDEPLPDGRAGCTACHGVASWSPAGFDHARDALYPLEGAHRATACLGCHPRESRDGRTVVRYRPVGRACADCHATPVAEEG